MRGRDEDHGVACSVLTAGGRVSKVFDQECTIRNAALCTPPRLPLGPTPPPLPSLYAFPTPINGRRIISGTATSPITQSGPGSQGRTSPTPAADACEKTSDATALLFVPSGHALAFFCFLSLSSCTRGGRFAFSHSYSLSHTQHSLSFWPALSSGWPTLSSGGSGCR